MSNTKVNTPQFRVAFPAVFTAKRNDLANKDEFSLVALFPKGADLTVLKQAAQAALIKKFGEDKKKWPVPPSEMRNPFRDQGDREKVDPETGKKTLPQGYEKGAIYISLRSKQRPGVVDQNVQEIIDQADFYGGCWAVASVNAYAYDTAGNQGVSFGLGNLQKIKDDDAFGNRTKPQDDFAPVANTETASNAESANDLFT